MMFKQGKNFFPGQAKEEKVFLLIRKHWFNYIPFAMFGILMVIPFIVVVVFWFMSPSLFTPTVNNIFILGLSCYFLSMLGLQLYGFVSFYLDVYIVTDRRIVDISQEGFFRRQISELHLHQVQDVNAKVQGIFPTLLHYGDVYIQTAGERENFIFQSIPHPYNIAKQIIDLHENHIKTIELGERPKNPSDDQLLLEMKQVEDQAKGLLSRHTFSKRLKNPGIYESDHYKFFENNNKNIQNTSKNQSKELQSPQKVDKINRQNEGQLSEGKEVSFE